MNPPPPTQVVIGGTRRNGPQQRTSNSRLYASEHATLITTRVQELCDGQRSLLENTTLTETGEIATAEFNQGLLDNRFIERPLPKCWGVDKYEVRCFLPPNPLCTAPCKFEPSHSGVARWRP